MSIEEFVEKFAEQFDDTDVAEFKADTKFHDFDEWSAGIALNIIAMVDDEYDVTLKGADIEGAATIEDLFKVVSSRKA